MVFCYCYCCYCNLIIISIYWRQFVFVLFSLTLRGRRSSVDLSLSLFRPLTLSVLSLYIIIFLYAVLSRNMFIFLKINLNSCARNKETTTPAKISKEQKAKNSHIASSTDSQNLFIRAARTFVNAVQLFLFICQKTSVNILCPMASNALPNSLQHLNELVLTCFPCRDQTKG